MADRALNYMLLYLADLLSILLVLLALRWPQKKHRSSWLWPTAGLLAAAFIARTIFFAFHDGPVWCFDFWLMWGGGASALHGKNPYTLVGYSPPYQDVPVFHYPPYSLPLFKLLALAPFPMATVMWTVINVIICLGLGLLARQALVAQDGDMTPAVTPAFAALLTCPVLLSISTNLGIRIGQSSFLVICALLGALIVQAGRKPRPFITAAFLTIASIKPQLLAPFLLLFLRRRDVKTWLLLGVFVTALLLAVGSPRDLPASISAMFESIAAARAPGSIDDYSMANPESMTIIGFDHFFARVGIGDRRVIAALSYLCVIVLGAWVAYIVTRNGDRGRGASCSLVSLYSLVFIYHRYYDLVILIIPLIYCASRIHTRSWPARWCYAWVLAAILLSLNAPYGVFYSIQASYRESAMVRILVLPSVLYLILSAMAALVAAGSLEARLERSEP